MSIDKLLRDFLSISLSIPLPRYLTRVVSRKIIQDSSKAEKAGRESPTANDSPKDRWKVRSRKATGGEPTWLSSRVSIKWGKVNPGNPPQGSIFSQRGISGPFL